MLEGISNIAVQKRKTRPLQACYVQKYNYNFFIKVTLLDEDPFLQKMRVVVGLTLKPGDEVHFGMKWEEGTRVVEMSVVHQLMPTMSQ